MIYVDYENSLDVMEYWAVTNEMYDIICVPSRYKDLIKITYEKSRAAIRIQESTRQVPIKSVIRQGDIELYLPSR